MKKKNIILIGFMGSGKTTVGKQLAKMLKIELLDTDDMIEKKQGMSINSIFEKYGEDAFRAMETELLRELAKRDGISVISTGGGLPVREENRELLAQLGNIYYLKASQATLVCRLRNDRKRPLLRGDNLDEKIARLMAAREDIYNSVSTRIIETDRLRTHDICERIINYENSCD